MTYDVQRWDSPDYDVELDPLDDGLWVLAADAEAHEKAALEAVFSFHAEWTFPDMCKPGCLACRRLTELWNEHCNAYDAAIRNCIAVVERMIPSETGTQLTGAFLPKRSVIKTLNAILEGK